ncbi:hypothetical protein [Pseudoalteromonas luteoviolacea]|uniref:Uncharacterized protein n=1 Tax=Pseudoalteromonas luteoviolacea (strain 2ta16) TaxID=1353533 RepID=V4I2X9_PSEL2|nr:hypothetical protein [Pseudoalteromonas luteoviolacea]ESP94594.1 hypothetical protein PL2TA16_00594 [Pseudoalteromonas luteoviolacea 2ta16]KZN32292.1 hypothetical protein N483_03845 [Pseudoalteromonas luteoviolacea NCIMB 1944]
MKNAKIKQQKYRINDKKLLKQICAGCIGKGSGPKQQHIDGYLPTK